MGAHYLKILDWLREHAAQAAALRLDWKTQIFEDLTGGRGELRVVDLEPNHRGPRVGLFGQVFFCEAGADHARADTLFIMRVEPAADRRIRAVPRRVKGDFRLLSADRHPSETLGSVAGLLGWTERVASPVHQDDFGRTPLATTGHDPVDLAIGVRLREFLRNADATLRDAWSPGAGVRSTDPGELLDRLHRVARRFRLSRHVRGRGVLLMEGRLRPSAAEPAIRQLLSVSLLNSFAEDPREEAGELGELLMQLAELPVEAELQAQIWAQTLTSLEPAEVRLVLHRASSALAALDGPTASAWGPQVLECLRQAAQLHGDSHLLSVVDRTAGEDAPLLNLAEWAGSLQFDGLTDVPASESASHISLGPEDQAEEAELPAPSMAVGVATDLAPIDESFGTWVISLRTEQAHLEGLAAQMRETLQTFLSELDRPRRVDDLIALQERLAQLQLRLEEWRRQVPTKDALTADAEEASAALQSLSTTIGAEAALHIVAMDDAGRRPDPADLREIARVCERNDLMRLPDWLWPSDAEKATLPLRGVQLRDPLLRRRIERCLATLEEAGPHAVNVLEHLAPPEEGLNHEMRDAYFERALSRAADLDRVISDLSRDDREWAARAITGGGTAGDVGEVHGRLLGMKARLSEHSFQVARAEVIAGDFPSMMDVLSEYEAALDQLETALGSAEDATPDQIKRARANLPKRGTTRARARESLVLTHNRVDATGRRVPLVFRAYKDKDRPYGSVAVPLVIQSRRAQRLELLLDIQVDSPLHHHWPSNWESPGPVRLSIGELDWVQVDTELQHAFALRVPLRVPSTNQEHIELRIKGKCEVTGQELQAPEILRWDRVLSWDDAIPFDWADTIRPSYVREHPVGPQQEHSQIIDLARAGGSFAVLAPRRFGKSTLVEYLHEAGAELGLAVPHPTVCTAYVKEGGIDLESLWTDLSDRLEGMLGARIAPGLTDGLPTEGAFDRVRVRAREEGFAAVLLLFDEAQLFFPRDYGYEVGTRLKDRLERNWSRTNRLKDQLERHWSRTEDGLPPVVIGFIGLPTFEERAGVNLLAMLRVFRHNEIAEADLNRLILRLTRERLHTTRAARARLTERSGNLYILKSLLQRLLGRVNAELRNWVAFPDVVEVERELTRALQDGEETTVACYMRDVLNDAPDVNEWLPKPCYAAAVALAEHGRLAPGTNDVDLESVRQRVDEWCSSVSSRHQRALVYTPERLREHLATLGELGVHDGVDFRSPLLRAWLVGMARKFPSSEMDRQALFRSALQRLRLPQGLEPVETGGQAAVFRFVSENRVACALRKVVLETEESRKRFLETVETLDVVRRRLELREPGAEFIFNLREVGLGEDGRTGIEIYQWIEGIPLSEKVGKLSPSVVAAIGQHLATALRLLHRHNVIHRDISPGNVILSDDGFRPVLIDFGLARLSAGDLRTQVDGIHSAPEVRSSKPQWTAAADIHALGSTLRSLCSSKSPELDAVLDGCVAQGPEARPDADALLEALTGVLNQLHVSERASQASNAIRDSAGSDLSQGWYAAVVDRFSMRFGLMGVGLHGDVYDVSLEVAAFLDQVLEAYPVAGTARTLGWAKREPKLASDELELLHRLRIERSHYTNRDRLALRRRHRVVDDVALRKSVVAGSQSIARFVSLPELPAVVEQIFVAATRF